MRRGIAQKPAKKRGLDSWHAFATRNRADYLSSISSLPDRAGFVPPFTGLCKKILLVRGILLMEIFFFFFLRIETLRFLLINFAFQIELIYRIITKFSTETVRNLKVT